MTACAIRHPEERHISFEESYDGELKQLITDMITVSDNTAANTLLERLGNGDAMAGMAVVNEFCQENGYAQTSFGRKFLEAPTTGDNWTSANDCRNLLASIWQGTCVNAEASGKMLEYLKIRPVQGKFRLVFQIRMRLQQIRPENWPVITDSMWKMILQL